MASKGFTGAPFGTQAARFCGPLTYSKDKRPSTHAQKPNGKTVSSDVGKTSSSGWTKAQEAAWLSQIPHFHFKEIWKKTKYLKDRLGPGTYNIKDFLQETRPSSTRGICDTGEERFKDTIRDCYPGPGTYGRNGNPYALIEEKETFSAKSQGIMDSRTAKCIFPSAAGSGLGPGTYNLKNSIDELLNRVVSKRGPYDTFSGDRSKPVISGHYAVEKKLYEPGASNPKSFVEELETKNNKKKGAFSTLAQNPGCPTERIFWATLSQCPRDTYAAGPGSYDPKPIERSEYDNQPPFLSSAKRFDRRSCRLFFANSNPVGVGRYDITKQEKSARKTYRSLYLCDTQRYLNDLERDACFLERIKPVSKSYWHNLASASSEPDRSAQAADSSEN
ncbi:lymphocyte expansion molecule [Alligator sinensis]|uniref:Lymphocyte expansion molecule n=1 Tax=Alligator sinensis TaxID=38654 RepID=A0A1U7RM74_ALLSI|nr:lymphocyte expansion molecule [Alligator sinensis]